MPGLVFSPPTHHVRFFLQQPGPANLLSAFPPRIWDPGAAGLAAIKLPHTSSTGAPLCVSHQLHSVFHRAFLHSVFHSSSSRAVLLLILGSDAGTRRHSLIAPHHTARSSLLLTLMMKMQPILLTFDRTLFVADARIS